MSTRRWRRLIAFPILDRGSTRGGRMRTGRRLVCGAVDPAKEFAPVAKFMDSFQILVVHPSSPWMSVKDLVAYAKSNPGKLNYAHVGPGHLTHLAGELFMQSTGTSLVGVAYRGGQ